MKSRDVVVVGGGPAGAAAAQRLARQGLSVMVVEKSRFPRRKVCGEFVSAPTWPLLDLLQVSAALLPHAGPPVLRVGLFAGDVVMDAPMPPSDGAPRWGCALGRHLLDEALLDAAAQAGALVRQPAVVCGLGREGGYHRVRIEWAGGRDEEVLSRIVVDAHGSWERMVQGQPPARPGDLLGFKARFTHARLAAGLMPLVLFPGGYGGLVESDSGMVSFSCCIRRDVLRSIRAGQRSAGDAVLAHAMRHCRGVREAIGAARIEQPWLAAGPIRPGIRALGRDGILKAGNAAGEAHPLIAEGITMAIQSGCLLAQSVAAQGSLSDDALARAAADYGRAWRRQLATRVRASQLFATLTMSPLVSGLSREVLRRAPAMLTLGARFSGKARRPSIAGALP